MSTTKQHEYAFDCNLNAVVRVKANSEAEARTAMNEILDACEINAHFLSGYNSKQTELVVTEASIGHDPAEALLFERDGVEVA